MTVRQISLSRMLPESKAASPFGIRGIKNDMNSCRTTLMALAQEPPGAVLSTMDRPAVVTIAQFYKCTFTDLHMGIERKIREAYRHLCLTYTDAKDEIILIGFSRGAFTVRCLASLIHDVGLLYGGWVNKELPAIFELWKKQKNSNQHDDSGDKQSTPLEDHCQELIAKYGKIRQQAGKGKQSGKILRRGVHIKVCAVWDTVKSLGFPWPKSVPHKESKEYHFVNYRLTPNIDNAFQALSLDERRWHFSPVVWSKSHEKQALKQCWFLGNHSDIGGGYRNAGFANISLCWMISQLKHFVLFNEKAIWHSTEDGKILSVDVAKENRELFTPGRGRMTAVASRFSLFPRTRSGPPGGKIRSSKRESLTTHRDVPSITVSQAAAEPIPNVQGREADSMDEPGIPVLPGFDFVTSDEASLNPEAEATNVREDSDGSSLNTSDADGSEGRPLAIRNMRRHTWQGFWVFGGSKTRKVGIHRTAGDDSRSWLGEPLRNTPENHLGSNESIHFSVRVLTEIHPLQGRRRCRALGKFKVIENPEGSFVWRCTKAGSNIRDIPQDTAETYEQAMLHRWLDRDFTARGALGGQKASEAIAGSTLSPAVQEPIEE